MIDAARLKAIPIFQDLSDADRSALAAIVSVRPMKRGQTIFSRGETRSTFYIPLQGQIHIYRQFQDVVQTLAILDPNEYAVETSLVYPDEKHEHYAEALTDGEVLEIAGKDFLGFREKHPEIASRIYGKMLKNVRSRLHHVTNKMVTIYSTGRIASTYKDLENITDLILESILAVIKARRALFALYRPLEGRVEIRNTKGYENAQKIRNLELNLNNDPILGILYKGKRAITISEEQYKDEKALHTPYASRNMLGVPLVTQDTVIGAILLGDKVEQPAFSHNNEILLNIIAHQIVPAILAAEREERLEGSQP